MVFVDSFDLDDPVSLFHLGIFGNAGSVEPPFEGRRMLVEVGHVHMELSRGVFTEIIRLVSLVGLETTFT